MPTTVSSEVRHTSRSKRHFTALYGAIVLLSLHWAIVLYINSSYLEQFVESSEVGMLYTIGAALTIIGFLVASRVLSRTGNYVLTLLTAGLEFLILIGMAFAQTPYLAIPLFILHQMIVPLILFHLDVFMEEMIGDEEGRTGGKRGLLLTLMSFAGAMAPLIAGSLIGTGTPDFSHAYLASALLLLPFMLIIWRTFRTFKNPDYPTLALIHGFTQFWGHKDVRNVFFSHFLLQLFFAWMVIYTPLYLSNQMGLNWVEIGQVLFAGLMAYVLLEYSIGVVADTWLGEKEMMAVGFLIIVISTSWFSFITTASLGVWMFAMFMTRVGASFVETTTESYFFKHTAGKDTSVISFFRITRPLSIIIGALLGSLTLSVLPFNLLFIVLGLLMIPGFFFTMALKDTR